MGRPVYWGGENARLPPGALRVSSQHPVRSQDGDRLVVGQPLDRDDGDPIAVGRKPVLHGNGAHVVVQHIGRVFARDPNMDLFPAAVVGGQRIVDVSVAIPDDLG
jgi:hypothetical protein